VGAIDSWLAATLLSVGLLVAGTAAATDLTPAETRGKRIYLHGESSSGVELTAFVGTASVPIPATATPCASCHGTDGTGRPEGGVVPSDIRWSRLTTPYGVTSPGARRHHPAYDEQSLARAIAMGVDPAGNRLDASMPKFPLPAADLTDLLAYLKRLESDQDPGLSEDRIVIGTVLPGTGPMQSLGEAVSALLTAYFADVSTAGGIYHRKIDLVVATADTPAAMLAEAARLIDEVEVFALVSAFTGGADREFAELVETREVPVIGPFTQFPRSAGLLPRFNFYLLSGLMDQGRGLIDFAAADAVTGDAPIAIVHAGDVNLKEAALEIETYARQRGWDAVLRREYAPEQMDADALVAELRAAGSKGLFFFGDGRDFLNLATAAVDHHWLPRVFLSGAMTGRDVFAAPPEFSDRIFVAYPTVPADNSPAGRQEFTAFHSRHGLERQHFAAQTIAYSAAKVLLEALKRSGRELSRPKLVAALEGLHKYDTGLTPTITFSANRRIGALGAHIIAVDLEKQAFAVETQWVEPQ